MPHPGPELPLCCPTIRNFHSLLLFHPPHATLLPSGALIQLDGDAPQCWWWPARSMGFRVVATCFYGMLATIRMSVLPAVSYPA